MKELKFGRYLFSTYQNEDNFTLGSYIKIHHKEDKVRLGKILEITQHDGEIERITVTTVYESWRSIAVETFEIDLDNLAKYRIEKLSYGEKNLLIEKFIERISSDKHDREAELKSIEMVLARFYRTFNSEGEYSDVKESN